MTSNLSEAVPVQLAPVVDVNEARIVGAHTEGGFGPRHVVDDTDADLPHTRAGLFVGLLLCASSSALMVWLATLLV
jgi:hypothetical protein